MNFIFFKYVKFIVNFAIFFQTLFFQLIFTIQCFLAAKSGISGLQFQDFFPLPLPFFSNLSNSKSNSYISQPESRQFFFCLFTLLFSLLLKSNLKFQIFRLAISRIFSPLILNFSHAVEDYNSNLEFQCGDVLNDHKHKLPRNFFVYIFCLVFYLFFYFFLFFIF